jgi:hypothetical protein
VTVTFQTKGEIVLREEDPELAGVAYLRVMDEDERVWVMAVNGKDTEITNAKGLADMGALTKGVRVRAVFPRVDTMPVASSVTIQ